MIDQYPENSPFDKLKNKVYVSVPRLELGCALMAKNQRGFKLFLSLGHSRTSYWRLSTVFDVGGRLRRAVHYRYEVTLDPTIVDMLAFAPFYDWELIDRERFNALIHSSPTD